MDSKSGRSLFEIRGEDRDYSGLSLADRYLIDADIERSFFNGVNLANCVFSSVKMNNTEFSEAHVKASVFQKCDLSGSDFVDSLFENVTFEECAFDKGEWRDSVFRNCCFVRCSFDHTTVTLCSFSACQLDATSIRTAEHRAFYFNVFVRCEFSIRVSERHFASRNFGIPAVTDQNTLVASETDNTIEQLCLLNNIGKLRAIDVAGVAETLCLSLARGTQRRTSTLVFYSKTVRALTDERRISATSLIYIEEIIMRLASEVDDQDIFTAAMAAIVEIRSAAFSIATDASVQASEYDSAPITHITVRFSERYTRAQADALRDTLAATAGDPNAMSTGSVRHGSTIINILTSHVVEVGAFFVAVNFVLRQAKTTLKLSKEVTGTLKKALKKTPAKARRRTLRKPNKLPAVLKSGAVLPSLEPVRAAVHRHGRVLVEMDEPAEITVTLVQQAQRRR